MEENDDEEEKHSEAEVINIFLSSGCCCCCCCCCIRFSFFKGELSRGVFADPIKLTGEPSVGQCWGMPSLLAFPILQNVVDKEVSVLARLTFHKNLLIGQVKSVRCPH